MSGGKGTRMLPLTENTNKSLIEINGKPFLSYLIENLKQAGLTDLLIIVGWKKEKVEEYLKENNIKAEVVEQKEPLGSGDAVKYARDFVGDDNFVLIGGDTLVSPDDFKQIAKNDDFNYVIGQKTDTPERFGIFLCDGEFLVETIEKPQEFVGDLANIGVYKFTPKIFEELDKVELSPRGEYELTDAISALAKKRKVKIKALKDYWVDMGTKEDIPGVEEFLKDK